jgi:chromosome segregation ATPase
MKLSFFALACGTASAVPGPIGKVLEMIGDLEQKIISEGENSQKVYEEHSEFCEDRNKELSFEIKTGESQVEDLTSSINKAAADNEELDAKIGDLAAQIAEAEKELKEATGIRQKENAEFVGVEKDLVETVDTIARASGIIEKEMAKGASFAQLTGAQGLVSALDTIVKSSMVSNADSARLTALIQGSSANEEDDDSEAAPAAAAYESKSGGILDQLAELQGKAEDELEATRKAEAKALQDYTMKKQSLEAEIKFASKDMDDSKKTMSANAEKKAENEGELETVRKDLAEDKSTLAALHADCMSKASDFEAETTSRGEELKALATAKKVIQEATGAALTQVSLLQVSQQESAMQAVTAVRQLAFAQRSSSLARLAAKMESAAKQSANPFKKVVEMLNGMIAKLEKEAEEEAAQKEFCDKGLKEANEKKEAATTAIDKLNVKIEQGVAKSTKLQEEVMVLQAELAKLMAAQQEMDSIRKKENAVFVEEEAELKKGLKGIQTALKVLKDYYAANDSGNEGAGGGIISLLEVCESDISKELAQITAAEEDAQAKYDAETKENEMSKTVKDKDVEFKSKEIAALAKAKTEHDADLSAVQDELDAVMAGLAQLEKQCLGKAESYAAKVAKQKAEVDGLKSALSSLGGASLLQIGRRVHRTTLRGSLSTA